jgi:hypothetical protein
MVFIHPQEFWLLFHTKLLLQVFDILPQIILILSCTVTAKIFKLPFFHTPIRFPDSGRKNKALVLEFKCTVIICLTYIVKVKKGLYIYIYIYMRIPMHAFCICFELLS